MHRSRYFLLATLLSMSVMLHGMDGDDNSFLAQDLGQRPDHDVSLLSDSDDDSKSNPLTVKNTFRESLGRTNSEPTLPYSSALPLQSLPSSPTQGVLAVSQPVISNLVLQARILYALSSTHIPSSLPLPSSSSVSSASVAPAQSFVTSSDSSAPQSNMPRITGVYHSRTCSIPGCAAKIEDGYKHPLQHMFTHFNDGYTKPRGCSFEEYYQCPLTGRRMYASHKESCPKGEDAMLLLNPEAEEAACQVFESFGMSLPPSCRKAKGKKKKHSLSASDSYDTIDSDDESGNKLAGCSARRKYSYIRSDGSFKCPLPCDTPVQIRRGLQHAIRHILYHFKRGHGVPSGYSFTECFQCSCGKPLGTRSQFKQHKTSGSCADGEKARFLSNPVAEKAACQLLDISLPSYALKTARKTIPDKFPEDSVFGDCLAAQQSTMHTLASSAVRATQATQPSPIPALLVAKRKTEEELTHPTDKKSKVISQQKKGYQCKECKYIFTTPNIPHAMSCLERNNTTQENLYTCEYCKEEFKTKSEIAFHVKQSLHKTRVKDHIKARAYALFTQIS